MSVVTVVSVMPVVSVAGPLRDPYGTLTEPLQERCGFVAREIRRVGGHRKECPWKEQMGKGEKGFVQPLESQDLISFLDRI